MKEIIYLSSPPLLDNAIEQVKYLSEKNAIHFVILVSNSNSTSSIFELNDNLKPGIYRLEELNNDLKYFNIYRKYLENCKSAYIIVFSNSLSMNIKIYVKLFKLKIFKLSILHFDDISGLGLIVLLRFAQKKIILTIHDPIPHSGEFSILNLLVKKIAFLASNYFVVYSKFAKNQFISRYGVKEKIIQLNLIPYNFYTMIKSTFPVNKRNEIVFLFFGRISPYKGVYDLINTFNNILSNGHNIKLIIAGKGMLNTSIDQSKNIEIKNHYIDINEMTKLFHYADVLVCPYKDATQSGVIMTALAFNLPHIVSNVGALPENSAYPELVYDITDLKGLEKTMLHFTENINTYKSKDFVNRETDIKYNVRIMTHLYKSIDQK